MNKIFRFSDFLKNREDRFKPIESEKFGLKRIEKINFVGDIFLSDKKSNTDMILVKSGDLVISGINVEKGAVAVYEGKDDILATIHYSSYQYDSSIIDVEYLKLFIKSPQFKKLIFSATNGGIKTEIKPKHLLPLEILLPNICEQNKIVLKINEALKTNKLLLELQESQINSANIFRQSILQDAIQGKLVPQDPNDEPAEKLLEKIRVEKEELIKEGKLKREKPLPPIKPEEIQFDLPKGWVWIRLGDLTSKLGDGLHGTPDYSDKGDYFFINGNNLNDGKILIKSNTKKVTIEEYNKFRKTLNDRTILVSINGTIGNIAFFNNEKVVLGKSACYFNLLSEVNKFYISTILSSTYFLKYAMKSATGTTIKNVPLKGMRLFLVPLPPLNEQKRIVEKVNYLLGICDEQEKHILQAKEKIKKLNQAILREMFD